MSEPRLHAYAIGTLYHPARARFDEGAQYNYRGGEHELVVFLAAPAPKELRAFRGDWQFGLVVRPEVLFLLYQPGGMPWSDAPYGWHQVQRGRPAEAVPPFELPTPESRALLNVVLVDAETGIIRHLKGVTFSPAFSRALHAAISAQIEHPVTAAEYGRAVDRYYRTYARTEDLLARAEVRCTGGEP